jgi:hypothetical protein
VAAQQVALPAGSTQGGRPSEQPHPFPWPRQTNVGGQQIVFPAASVQICVVGQTHFPFRQT